MPIKAISFDFWSTLFTEAPGAFLLYQARRRSFLEQAVLTHRAVAHGELDKACLAEAESHNRIWKEQHRTALAAERLGQILNHLEISLPETSLAELVTAFEENILEHPPVLIEGAREAVTQLSGRYRLGIISDVGFAPGRVLKQILADNEILHLFDSLVFSDEAGRAKPHIELFERTARSLAAAPEAMVHIGDLERTDIIGAKEAGFAAIRFTGITTMSEGETTIADFVTDDLTQIPRLVEMLDRGLE